MSKNKFTILIALLIFIVGFLNYSSVNNEITSEDKLYINKILEDYNIKKYSGVNYKDEIEFIENVLNATFQCAPSGVGLPLNSLREPKNIYLAKRGACFDKSRVMEKIFRDNGFKTRHVSSYLNKNDSKLKTLLTPGIESHAATEVLTQKGWVVLGTYEKWISIDKNNKVHSSENIRLDVNKNIKWKYPMGESSKYYYAFKENKMIIIYGLYSRHGKFYPPYNFVPDIEYREFLYNFK